MQSGGKGKMFPCLEETSVIPLPRPDWNRCISTRKLIKIGCNSLRAKNILEGVDECPYSLIVECIHAADPLLFS